MRRRETRSRSSKSLPPLIQSLRRKAPAFLPWNMALSLQGLPSSPEAQAGATEAKKRGAESWETREGGRRETFSCLLPSSPASRNRCRAGI